MLKSVILNYPDSSLTIYDQGKSGTKNPLNKSLFAESIKDINDLLWSFALLEQDYELDIKISPKKPDPEKREFLFKIIDGFYKRNPKLMSIVRYIAEKKIYPEAGAIERLSPMQKKILVQVRNGLTYTHIAKKFSLSPHTVNGHRKKAMKVLGVRNMKSLLYFIDRFEIE